MPKILIKETDKTSAGTPSSYENYAVLLVGFTGDDFVKYEPANEATYTKPVKPDSNGVYEFTSKGDFEATIGLVGPKEENFYHCGNQMAYELLGMGYSIIYKPITKTEITYESATITKDDFWAIFKDKANYDFRFITHGFLKTAVKEGTVDVDSIKYSYNEALARKKELDVDTKTIENIVAIADAAANYEEDRAAWHKIAEEEFQKLINQEDFTGFTKPDGTRYASLEDDALDANNVFVTLQENGARTGVEEELKKIENVLATLSAGMFTPVMLNEVNGQIANLAKYIKGDEDKEAIPGRGDCTALIELDENIYTSISTSKPEMLIIEGVNELSQINADNGKYCAMTVPSVVYKMADNEIFTNNKKFPGAFHYLACFKQSLGLGFAEWYAAAGYTRGVSSYVIDTTSVKLGEIAINALEPRNYGDPQEDYPKFACNVIANFRGSYYLWGNRTAHPLGSKDGGNDLVASHFLNIRQLCTTIKKQLYVACRRFTFDPNSDTLWVNFCAAIRPTLEAMKADQGVRDYKIVKEFTDKKATLKAKIRIIPIEAVEDFDLEVSLEDSFGETTAVVNE